MGEQYSGAATELFLTRERAGDIAHLVRSEHEFTELGPDWQRLHGASGTLNPFLGFAWTRACFETSAGKLEPFILTLRRHGRLVGLAPLCIERRAGVRVVHLIADQRSDYLGFISAAGEPGVEEALLDALATVSREWDVAVLRQLADPFTPLHNLAAAGLVLHRTRWTTSAFCRWQGDWESLHDSGPPWLREMRKRRRRFARDGGEARRFTGAAAIEQLDIVARIERDSWKGRARVTRLQPGGGQELLRRAFAYMPEAELWLAFIAGRPVAFQVAFVAGDRLWLHQASYDERFGKTRAGSVATYSAIEEAWRNGIREYDYLAGDEPYKLQRTSELRAIHYIAAHPRTARGWLSWALLVAPRWKLRNVPAFRHAYDFIKRSRPALS